jgi:hypothetical protein
MKRFVTLLLILPLLSEAQRIEENQVDKFTGQRRVQTSSSTLKIGTTNGLAAHLRASGDSYLINLSGYGQGVGIVRKGAKAILLLENDSTLTVFAPETQSYEVSAYQNTFDHQYTISLADLQTLRQYKVKSIRRYTTEGYVDTDIPRKNQDEIKKLSSLFLGALSGAR